MNSTGSLNTWLKKEESLLANLNLQLLSTKIEELKDFNSRNIQIQTLKDQLSQKSLLSGIQQSGDTTLNTKPVSDSPSLETLLALTNPPPQQSNLLSLLLNSNRPQPSYSQSLEDTLELLLLSKLISQRNSNESILANMQNNYANTNPFLMQQKQQQQQQQQQNQQQQQQQPIQDTINLFQLHNSQANYLNPNPVFQLQDPYKQQQQASLNQSLLLSLLKEQNAAKANLTNQSQGGVVQPKPQIITKRESIPEPSKINKIKSRESNFSEFIRNHFDQSCAEPPSACSTAPSSNSSGKFMWESISTQNIFTHDHDHRDHKGSGAGSIMPPKFQPNTRSSEEKIVDYSQKLLEYSSQQLFSRDSGDKKTPGTYTRDERINKILAYKKKILKWRFRHPVNRAFTGRSQVAGGKPRIKGKFVKAEEYMSYIHNSNSSKEEESSIITTN